jgi:hypothetical protein
MDVTEVEFAEFGASAAHARTADRPGPFSPGMDGYRALLRHDRRRDGPIAPMLRGIRRIPVPAGRSRANMAARLPHRSLKRRSLPIR